MVRLNQKEIVYLNDFVKRKVRDNSNSEELSNRIDYLFRTVLSEGLDIDEIRKFVKELKKANRLSREVF